MREQNNSTNPISTHSLMPTCARSLSDATSVDVFDVTLRVFCAGTRTKLKKCGSADRGQIATCVLNITQDDSVTVLDHFGQRARVIYRS